MAVVFVDVFSTPAFAAIPHSDSMSVYYTHDTNHWRSSAAYHRISGLGAAQTYCPHIGTDAPSEGWHTAYWLDKHLDMLTNPVSGKHSAARSASEVLRMWKLIAYYGYGGPGYDASIWRDLAVLDDYQGDSIDNITIFMHLCLSNYWLGNSSSTWYSTVPNAFQTLYNRLNARAASENPDLNGVQIYMFGDVAHGEQEVVFWQFIHVSGVQLMSKVPLF